jgi:MinD-like ATPase involved in chromosome partitioning or flagellar assembly
VANQDKNQLAGTEDDVLDDPASGQDAAATGEAPASDGDDAAAQHQHGEQRPDGDNGLATASDASDGLTRRDDGAPADQADGGAPAAPEDPRLPVDPAHRPVGFAASYLPPDPQSYPAQAEDDHSERGIEDSTAQAAGYAPGSSPWIPAGPPPGYAQQSPYAAYGDYESPGQDPGYEGYGQPGYGGDQGYGQPGYGQGSGYAPVEGYGYAQPPPEYGDPYGSSPGYGEDQRYTDDARHGRGQAYGDGSGYGTGQAYPEGQAYPAGERYGEVPGYRPGQGYGEAAGYAPGQSYGPGQSYSAGGSYGAGGSHAEDATSLDRDADSDDGSGQEPGQYPGSERDRAAGTEEASAGSGLYSQQGGYSAPSPYAGHAQPAAAPARHDPYAARDHYAQQARSTAEDAAQDYGGYPSPGAPPGGPAGVGYPGPPGAGYPGPPGAGPRGGPPQGAGAALHGPGSPGAGPPRGGPQRAEAVLAPLPAGQDQQQAAETADDLTVEALLPGKGTVPGAGWRRLVYKSSGGFIRPRESAEAVRRRELIGRVRTPVAGGHHRVAVMSLKGGVGKTTTTVSLGSMLASLRGDRIIALDANPDRGTLSDKVRLETAATVRDLLNERDQIQRYADVRAFTSQAPSRLEVLASDRDPTVSVAFCEDDYYDAAQVLEHYYSISLTDCGTGLLHSAMAGVLRMADQIILVSSPSVDGARSASATLDWLDAHEYGDLVRNAVVVLSMIRQRSKSSVDLDRLEHHFASRCRAVARIPYDAHLEEGAEVDLELMSPATVSAYLVLAATVGDGFAWPRRAARQMTLDRSQGRSGDRPTYRRYG